MGMFCVPDPLKSQILGYPKSQILGYSLVFPNPRSSVTGSCLRYGQVMCPRSSVTGSCLRYGQVLCPRSPATGSCLRHVVYIWARSRQPVYFWGWAVIQRFRQATQSCLVSWGVKSIYFGDNMPENELM